MKEIKKDTIEVKVCRNCGEYVGHSEYILHLSNKKIIKRGSFCCEECQLKYVDLIGDE